MENVVGDIEPNGYSVDKKFIFGQIGDLKDRLVRLELGVGALLLLAIANLLKGTF